MIRELIAQRVGYPLQDYFMKTSILKTLRDLRESQYWDESKLYEYRLNKLQKLIAHAYVYVPYYKELFDSIKLKPSDICKLDDIKKIPILTKEIVRSRNYDLVSKNLNMRHVKIGRTGGTTGVPIVVYKDTSTRTFTWASYYRWYDWMGVELGEKTLTLWGARTVTRKSLKSSIRDHLISLLQNRVIINSFNLNDTTLDSVITKIENSKPVLLKGYLSALLSVAEYLNQKNIKLTYPIKAISSTTETLLPHHRRFLTKILKAGIYDQYGCGETEAIAYECSQHNGLHINQEHVMLEILDKNNVTVVDKTGKIIVTDLDNFAMPFIRYENGDMATLLSEKCNCDINQPLLKAIDGRTIDTIALADGSKVHGVFFTDILAELNIFTDKIQRFQACQKKMGEIEFKIESKIDIGSALRENLYVALIKFFNKVDIVTVNKLENEPSGKFQYIKSLNSSNIRV